MLSEGRSKRKPTRLTDEGAKNSYKIIVNIYTYISIKTIMHQITVKMLCLCVITVFRYDLDDHKNKMESPLIFSVRV